MPSIRQMDVTESVVTCATTVGTDEENPITIIVRDADGNGIEGIPAAQVVLTVSGADNTLTQPSGFTNAEGEIDGAAFESSSSGERTPTVTVAGLAKAGPAVDVGTAPTLAFDSEWDTATGTTDNALGDGGVWDAFSGSGRANCLAVVANTGLGFTKTTNVFRMEAVEGDSGLVIANDAVPSQTDFWGQVYLMNSETNPDNVMLHCGTLLPVGSIQLAWLARWPGATTWQLGVRPAGTPHSRYQVTLDNDTWYRYAWRIVFTSSTQFRFYPEVYSYDDGDPTGPGTLLFDADDFNYEGIQSLAEFYAGGGYLSCSDLAGMRDLGLGSEDQSSWTTPDGYLYAAQMRLSTTGPVGPGA